MDSLPNAPKPKPPRWANRFLEWYCADELLDEIQGDLIEIYEHRVPEKGARMANWLFIKEVLLFFRPSSFKKKNPLENLPIMLSLFQSYLKTAARNIWKTKVFSSLNFIGLTAGFCAFLLIALYIQYELSFDRYHEKADRIYRVAQVQKGNVFRGTDRFALASSGLSPALIENFPEVESAATIDIEDMLFEINNRAFYESGLFCDEFLFDVFSFEMMEGDGPAALKDPDAIILTQSFVEKYFGAENPMGKTIVLEKKKPLLVKGIVKDPPKNSHFSFSYIASVKQLFYYRPGEWNNNSFYAYAVLKEGYAPEALEDKLIALDRKYLAREDGDPITESKFFLQPLKDIHLRSKLNFEISTNGDIRYLYLFATIAFIIVLIAAINYLNFAIADSERRSVEVGMRKALGARHGQLVQQFLGESFLLSTISLIFAFLLAFLFLPVLNQYLDLEINFSIANNKAFLLGLTLLVISIGGLSGLYPAFFIAKVAPVKALKGHIIGIYQKSNWLRNALVTGQFMAAIILAIGSLVVYQQLKFIQNKRLGFDQNHVVYVPYADTEFYAKSNLIKQELFKDPHIKDIAFSEAVPLNIGSSHKVREWEGSTGNENFWAYKTPIDYDFIDLYDMEIVQGRAFSTDFPADTLRRYILNETAVKTLGWTNAIGKSFNNGEVIGVIKDFHFQPFHLAIEPLYFELASARRLGFRGNLSLKVDGQNLEATIGHLQTTLKSIFPKVPFEYKFLDESLAQLYAKEIRLGRMFRIFTSLAILISILGLLGIASYNVIRRAKEISIRKVLGATAIGIIQMLTKDFVKLVVIALIIATPLAYFMMHRWLESFAYRISIPWQIFCLIGLFALILPMAIVGIQSIRTAQANPADNLRT